MLMNNERAAIARELSGEEGIRSGAIMRRLENLGKGCVLFYTVEPPASILSAIMCRLPRPVSGEDKTRLFGLMMAQSRLSVYHSDFPVCADEETWKHRDRIS